MSEPQGQADISPKQKWVDTFIGRSSLVLLTAALSIAGTITVTAYNNQMRFLDYYPTPASAVIPKVDLGGRQFVVTVDGKPIENISTVNLAVINNSGRNFTNAKLEVTFKSADGKPLEMLTPGTVSPRRVTENAKATTVPAGDTIQRDYTFDVINQSVDGSKVLEGLFVFAGPTAPQVTVDVVAEGVAARRQSIGNAGKSGSGWGYLIGGIIGAAMWPWIFAWLDKLDFKKGGYRKRLPT